MSRIVVEGFHVGVLIWPAIEHADTLIKEVSSRTLEANKFIALETVALAGLELIKRKIEVEAHWFDLDTGEVKHEVSAVTLMAEIGILATQTTIRARSALCRVSAH